MPKTPASQSDLSDHSDDEFQDAQENIQITEIHNNENKINSQSNIDELIGKQMRNAKLDEDEDQDDEKDEYTKCDEEDGAEKEEDEEYMDDVIDDDKQRELEKLMSPEELLKNKENADKMKLEGNELFKNNEALKAIDIYTEAIKICPTTYTKERAVLYGNRAAAKIQIDSKKSALQDCTKAVELWPDYVRVLIRRAKLYEHDDKLDEALEDYKRVLELDPGQRDAREASVRLPPIIAERNEKMKVEMMGKLKDLGNMILKPFGLSTENFQVQQSPTGSYSINFNQNKNSS